MLNEPFFGTISLLQGAACVAHVAVVLGLEHGLSRLIKWWRVDRLSLLENRKVWPAILRAVLTRLQGWVWLCGFYTLFTWHFKPALPPGLRHGWVATAQESDVLLAFTVLTLSSLLGRVVYVSNRQLRRLASSDASHWEHVVAVFCADALQVGLPFLAAFLVLPRLGLPATVLHDHRDVVNVLIVLATGYVVCRQVNLAADKVILAYRVHGGVDLRSRTLYTEVSALRKVILATLGFLTLATAMLFSAPLRQVGTSLLASAGLLSVVAGVAAQRSLGQLIAGFQLALTQPILLDDVVVVNGEFGRIEEITLAYVVVHLWDQRRLVVPIGFFLEKPFENWTRRSAQLLGTVFLYFDYQLPFEDLRGEFLRILEGHPLWDRRSHALEVTEARELSIQVRAVVSAADPEALWKLRCDVREALVRFVREKHPACLVRTRVIIAESSAADGPAQAG
ncbi:MAG TPA: mechanosensitive ion channel family protein [Chthoniobacterales bacterium]